MARAIRGDVREIAPAASLADGVRVKIPGFLTRRLCTSLLDDVVIVEGEWGRIEEIGSSYVVVRIWDERRMVVPLTWFIENPFQNWTRRSADLLGTAFLWLDYRAPIAAIRTELERI
ncbi:hypothetical protein G6F66_013646 [Rhizopus arrhizus]|nr:hypothetical protein G6F66_013646 [Rhizopus arrhizus]